MHRALEIVEIAEMVCQAVEWIHKGDLARLARTCGFFFNPAVNVLWRRPPRLSCLLKCMPNDLWDIIEAEHPSYNSPLNIVLRRSMTSADWERPLLYMHCVRSLSCSSSFVATDFLDALSWSLPGDCIFPNLEELDWHTSGYMHYLRLFLTPRLKTLSLGPITTFAEFCIFENLALKCPSLKDFFLHAHMTVDLRSPWDKATPIVSNFVCGLTAIESLNVPELNDVAIAHLTRLPHLKRLLIRERSNLTAVPPSGTFIRFPALTELAMPTMEQATAMITTVGACSLLDFTLFDTGDKPTHRIARQFYSTLARRCSHSSLQSIQIRGNYLDPPTIGAHEANLYAVGLDILEPLFCFTNLISVSLMHPVGFALDDAAMVAIARAWPRIEDLRLEAGPSHHIPSRVTLEGVGAFAQHCPHLQTLYLTFDASAVPKAKDDAASQRTLEFLNVALSPITNPRAVAEFLFTIFPTLTYIGTLCDDITEESEELEIDVSLEPDVVLSHSDWKMVQQSLQNLHS
ncbi:hypothetical protein MVEN_01504800 [Mycena venus]|uniref:F-box domain-containing protein n=1 Tax=Mycena venus TaxID=2733690 RepID=A0A8H7CTH8_9AGAR|nr:hypothetical protein MVEN_01504800 [Mycena venus]